MLQLLAHIEDFLLGKGVHQQHEIRCFLFAEVVHGFLHGLLEKGVAGCFITDT